MQPRRREGSETDHFVLKTNNTKARARGQSEELSEEATPDAFNYISNVGETQFPEYPIFWKPGMARLAGVRRESGPFPFSHY